VSFTVRKTRFLTKKYLATDVSCTSSKSKKSSRDRPWPLTSPTSTDRSSFRPGLSWNLVTARCSKHGVSWRFPSPTRPQSHQPQDLRAPRRQTPPLPSPIATKESLHPVLVELAAVAARLGRKSASADEPGHLLRRPATSERKSYRPPWPPVSAETVAGHAKTLVSLPTIFFQVERAINHPSSSSTDIAKALRTDQGLSARLLRIANSAFYGFPQRVESVDQAIRIIGTRQLHDLVLATVVLTQFRGVDANLVTMKSFWQHSFACGIAARSLATLRRESNVEHFFVAGLLHDIGSLVLYQEFPQRAAVALEMHRREKTALDEVERSVIGCDHGQVGAALMTLWKLPESYREVAANHHNPAGSRSPSVGTAVVHIADLLVAALALGGNGEIGLPRFCPEAWDLVALPPSDLVVWPRMCSTSLRKPCACSPRNDPNHG
jgi:putative nucleotidyltransferase with HDIG domain